MGVALSGRAEISKDGQNNWTLQSVSGTSFFSWFVGQEKRRNQSLLNPVPKALLVSETASVIAQFSL